MGQDGDAIVELAADHGAVRRLFDEIRAAPPGSDERRRLVEVLTIELVRHSAAEEQYLYPAVREYVVGGAELADKAIADHSRIEEILRTLEGAGTGDPGLTRLILDLLSEVTTHVRDEEERLFPRLRAACPDETLQALGEKIRRARMLAPTRPRALSPARQPVGRLLGPGVGLVDRVRDMLTGRGRRRGRRRRRRGR